MPSPVLPTVNVSTVESTADYPAGSNISLVCSWNTSVYYVAWYKNGGLLYEEDLAAPYVLMALQQGIYIASDFTMMMSNLTIANVTLDDSSIYTCAVTCGARGVEFGMIATNQQDTTEVFVYGKCTYEVGLKCLIPPCMGNCMSAYQWICFINLPDVL